MTPGVSAAGMSEADYTRSTYDLTLAAAGALARLDPGMNLVYVSGAGTDSTERGRLMWARVRGARRTRSSAARSGRREPTSARSGGTGGDD